MPPLSATMKSLVQSLRKYGITYHEGQAAFEKEWLQQELESTQGNAVKAAIALHMHRNTLSRQLAEHEVDINEIRGRFPGLHHRQYGHRQRRPPRRTLLRY